MRNPKFSLAYHWVCVCVCVPQFDSSWPRCSVSSQTTLRLYLALWLYHKLHCGCITNYTATALLIRTLYGTTITYYTNCTLLNEAHGMSNKHFIQIKVFLLPTKCALCPTKFRSLKQFFDYKKGVFDCCFDWSERPARNHFPTRPAFISRVQRCRDSNLCF